MDAPGFVNIVGETVKVDRYCGPSSSAGLNLSEEEVKFFRDLPDNQVQTILNILNKCAEKGFWLGKNSK